MKCFTTLKNFSLSSLLVNPKPFANASTFISHLITDIDFRCFLLYSEKHFESCLNGSWIINHEIFDKSLSLYLRIGLRSFQLPDTYWQRNLKEITRILTNILGKTMIVKLILLQITSVIKVQCHIRINRRLSAEFLNCQRLCEHLETLFN